MWETDRGGAGAEALQCWGVHTKQGGVASVSQGVRSQTPNTPCDKTHCAPASLHVERGPSATKSASQPTNHSPSEIEIAVQRMPEPSVAATAPLAAVPRVAEGRLHRGRLDSRLPLSIHREAHKVEAHAR